MKRLKFIATIFAVLSLAAFAYGNMATHGMGQEMMSGCGMDGQMMEAGHHMSKHIMAIDLDEKQKVRIGEIRSRMMKETIKKTADLRIVRIELRELLDQDPVDMKEVEAKVRKMEAMRSEMHISHLKAMEECKTQLSPEQRKQLKKMMETMPAMDKQHEMKHR